MEASIALVAIGPFVAAILAPLVVRFTGPVAGWLLALVPAAAFMMLYGLLETVAAGTPVRSVIGWIPDRGLDLVFVVDGLSLTFALAITGIGALIVLYTGAYLKGHTHLGRFMAFLLAFMGAMLGLVLADTLLALFVFWELTAITSFLLIGFDHQRQAARRGAIQALVVTNIGGLALLAGVVLIGLGTGAQTLSDLVTAGGLQQSPLYGPVLACILLAAFTKSAQVPFHFWLPNAMEAPTPVSAYLHSATMVQAGVYLLARMTPSLGGTAVWTGLLVGFGGLTLLWGAIGSLRQTDLKQMLAHSTVASLGLLVLLIGLGSETAIAGMALYFVAHALYKAGLFMVVGAVDHETGSRDITALSGLADRMPVTFIAAVLAGGAMIGLPPTLGYFAKEEMFLDLVALHWTSVVVVAVLVIGNAVLAAVGALIAIKPFLGPDVRTPRDGHEAPVAMLVGPVVLGAASIVGALLVDFTVRTIFAPAASTVLAHSVELHPSWQVNFASPVIWLTLASWALAYGVYRHAATLRSLVRRTERAMRWSFDRGFDWLMFGLIRLAGALTRGLHHGKLEIYLLTVFVMLALALFVPLLALGGLAALQPNADLGNWAAQLRWPELRLHEWGVMVLALAGLGVLLLAKNRLVAILALGVQGTAVALVFLMFGAPDLAFTQFMVEVLSVVIFALVMTRLRLDEPDRRPLEDLARDGLLAVVCGVGVTLMLLVVLSSDLDTRLSDLFAALSVPLAHGANIVNVILVDFRGLDTLGEISVVLGAGVAIMALLRRKGSTR